MEIVDVKAVTLKGKIMCGGPFWEERLVRPVDVYPKYKKVSAGEFLKVSEVETEPVTSHVLIITDEGVTGVSSPIRGPIQLQIIDTQVKPFLLGEDPLAIERLWDIMYRSCVHGRKGETMMAISAVDCALWDLIGKARGEPVYRLLGGPTRGEVRAYASTLGYSLDPKDVEKRAQQFVEEGYTAMKWFFRYGPSDGVKGMKKNLELVKTIRDAVGYDVDLMVDCWMSWSVPYTLKMAKKMERYELAWIEEPLMPDLLDGYAKLTSTLETPISGGEHEYTRWGFKEILQKDAMDIIQPDITWAGGITEILKICALASSYGVPVIPHTGCIEATIQLLFSQTQTLCPIAEYLIKYNQVFQSVYKNPLTPERGFFKPPTRPGLGIELDESKILE